MSPRASPPPRVIRAARAGGVTRFADSRLKNIIAAKTAIPGLHYLLIRIPAIDEAEEVVRWADCSLQSQIEVIRAVSDAAVRQGKIHPIILMVDVGDLREGVFGREQLEEIAGQILVLVEGKFWAVPVWSWWVWAPMWGVTEASSPRWRTPACW